MGTPFKLKSGNNIKGSAFKMMGSSPLKASGDDKFETYQTTLDNVTADMTDEELRDMAVAQHKVEGLAKGDKWNISYDTLRKQRANLNKPRVELKEVKEEAPVVEEEVTPVVEEDVVVEPKGRYRRDQDIYSDI